MRGLLGVSIDSFPFIESKKVGSKIIRTASVHDTKAQVVPEGGQGQEQGHEPRLGKGQGSGAKHFNLSSKTS